MRVYADLVLPRIIDRVMRGKDFPEIRARVTARLEGEVLEIGFGSGLNVPYYPPSVTRVMAVDPALVGRKLAAARVTKRGLDVDYLGLDGQDLPLDSSSVNQVLTTWSLCTIPDVERALREIRRVLRPGGSLFFVEHGRSPDARAARWQDRLTPLQRRIGGGCHLNRPIDLLVERSGLTLHRMDTYYAQGPKPLGYMFEGQAIKT